MWRASLAPLAGERGIHVHVRLGKEPFTFADAARAWEEDPAFRGFTCAMLADVPFAAFRWETPPFCAASGGQPFEFVALDCPELDRPADPAAFAPHFAIPDTGPVLVIPNLGRDAHLIVPRPLGPVTAYGHLGAFVREAPEDQKQALWRCVGAALQAAAGVDPVWLSTAGLGVAWLHARIDSRPKYYAYAPYRSVAYSMTR